MYYHMPHTGLLTDFYQLTMAQASFKHQRHNLDAIFQLYFRKNPFNGNYTIAAGIADALNFIQNYRFNTESLDFLASLRHDNEPLFEDDFLSFLRSFKNTISVFGVKDGDVVFPHEPLVRIEGPLFLCQLLETPLLNIINFQSLIATKAARIVGAANHKPVVDFGLRRAQGFDGAISATKAAYIGGVQATSNVWASKAFGIDHAGTQAHSFIMSFEHERDAFLAYAKSFPASYVLLIDTYDPMQGLALAIATFQKTKPSRMGIRLDSGDLLALSTKARAMLDEHGLQACQIIASGDLDEYEITHLEKSLAPIDSYGVGTKLITAYDQPSLGGVYKLVAIKENGLWRDTFKSSASSFKASKPGAKSITRFFKNNQMVFDVVHDKNNHVEKLLPPMPFDHMIQLDRHLMEQGVLLEATLDIHEARINAKANLASLPSPLRDIHLSNDSYPVLFESKDNNS